MTAKASIPPTTAREGKYVPVKSNMYPVNKQEMQIKMKTLKVCKF